MGVDGEPQNGGIRAKKLNTRNLFFEYSTAVVSVAAGTAAAAASAVAGMATAAVLSTFPVTAVMSDFEPRYLCAALILVSAIHHELAAWGHWPR